MAKSAPASAASLESWIEPLVDPTPLSSSIQRSDPRSTLPSVDRGNQGSTETHVPAMMVASVNPASSSPFLAALIRVVRSSLVRW